MRVMPEARMIEGPMMTVAATLLLLLLVGGVDGLGAQENRALEEGADYEQSIPGNVVQAAKMVYGQGKRDLDKAERMGVKADEAATEEKRAKLLEKRSAAYESAVENLMEALRLQPQMIEGYESLGLAFRRLGRYQEALQIHAIALQRQPESLVNFQGWAESLLSLDMLGNATASYTSYVDSNAERADILMAEMKKWLAARQADPGELDPAHVERMAEWIDQQEHGG